VKISEYCVLWVSVAVDTSSSQFLTTVFTVNVHAMVHTSALLGPVLEEMCEAIVLKLQRMAEMWASQLACHVSTDVSETKINVNMPNAMIFFKKNFLQEV
jgi:hypothetical protein